MREREREREREGVHCNVEDISFLLYHILIGWGQIRRGVVYKPLTSSEGGKVG